VNTSIETFSGRLWDYASPAVHDVELSDVATSLSFTCRYGGFIDRYYSVAEHACYTAQLLTEWRSDRSVVLAGLHHDTHEAYLGDVPSPLKRLLGDAYVDLARTHDAVIAEWLGIDPELFSHPDVKTADATLLRWESSFMKYSRGIGEHWGQADLPRNVPMWFHPGAMPADARERFVSWHHSLA
jgi:hypothetical protein